MGKINSIKDLRETILELEIKQKEDERLLREQFMIAYERLKPINMIKNSVKDMITSPGLKDQLISSTIGLAAGYLTKKAVVGSTRHHPLKQILGAFLQMGVTNLVAQNSDGIPSRVANLISGFLSKRKANRKNEE
jgi:hypothetical protein